MMHDNGGVASLQRALAEAERARDAALAEAATIQQRWQDERREEQHRLRNLFSVVRAVARRTGDDAETVEDYCGLLDGRLSAYLNIQAVVMQDWRKGADLALLLAGALQAFGLKEGERVDLVGPTIRLTSAAAGILALAFHELAFRAIASDRIAAPRSSLQIGWRLSSEGPQRNLLIDWAESAPARGKGEDAPSSWTEWVEQAIRYQLAGTLVMEAGDLTRATRICLPSAVMC